MTPVELSDRLLDFADRCSRVVDNLPDSRTGRLVAGQMERCCTSPMANYEEACAAESKRDFAHKLGICLKEIRETRIWLRFAARRELLPASRLDNLIDECQQLARIIGKSIATSKGVDRKKSDEPEPTEPTDD